MAFWFGCDKMADASACWNGDEPTAEAAAVVMLANAVGVPRVNEATMARFVARANEFEAVAGPIGWTADGNGGMVPLRVTREWAERWSGLVTNATAMTNAAWRKKLAAIKQAA